MRAPVTGGGRLRHTVVIPWNLSMDLAQIRVDLRTPQHQCCQDFHFLLQEPRTLDCFVSPGKPSASSISTPSGKGFRRVLEGVLKRVLKVPSADRY